MQRMLVSTVSVYEALRYCISSDTITPAWYSYINTHHTEYHSIDTTVYAILIPSTHEVITDFRIELSLHCWVQLTLCTVHTIPTALLWTLCVVHSSSPPMDNTIWSCTTAHILTIYYYVAHTDFWKKHHTFSLCNPNCMFEYLATSLADSKHMSQLIHINVHTIFYRHINISEFNYVVCFVDYVYF